MSEVISIFAATLLGFTILQPVHLLWINLITDCFPALALGMERAEPDIMRRRPRDAKAGIFCRGPGAGCGLPRSGGVGSHSDFLLCGPLYGVWSLGDRQLSRRYDHGVPDPLHGGNCPQPEHAEPEKQHLYPKGGQNKALNLAALASLALTTLVIEVPVLANAFGFTPHPPGRVRRGPGLGSDHAAPGGAGEVLPAPEEIRKLQVGGSGPTLWDGA